MKTRLIIVIAVMLALCSTTFATSFLELESTVLTNGWFQYRMKLLPDPFFEHVKIATFGPMGTNWVDYGASPLDWTNTPPDGWAYASTNSWQDRPYERIFSARNAQQSYRLGTTNLLITFSLWESGLSNLQWYYGVNVVGYALLPCLSPCPPEQADGTPPDYLYVWKIIPDLDLTSLILTNGTPYGVTYQWSSPCTVQLQSTVDLKNWSPITEFNGVAGTNVWTTNQPLNSFGSSFRLQLVTANNLTGNIVSQKAVSNPAVYNLQCDPNGSTVSVSFSTTADGNYTVQARTPDGTLATSKTVSVTGGRATVDFSPAALPTPVLFSVTPN